jgi:hypothetical protein
MKTEPNAETRAAAHDVRQMYVAYVDEGFTPDQALELCKAVLTAVSQRPERPEQAP